MDIYDRLGVRKVIDGYGLVTTLGGSLMPADSRQLQGEQESSKRKNAAAKRDGTPQSGLLQLPPHDDAGSDPEDKTDADQVDDQCPGIVQEAILVIPAAGV